MNPLILISIPLSFVLLAMMNSLRVAMSALGSSEQDQRKGLSGKLLVYRR